MQFSTVDPRCRSSHTSKAPTFFYFGYQTKSGEAVDGSNTVIIFKLDGNRVWFWMELEWLLMSALGENLFQTNKNFQKVVYGHIGVQQLDIRNEKTAVDNFNCVAAT